MTNPFDWHEQYEEYLNYEAAKSVNPNAALELVNLMSDISEGEYFASWIIGLEYSLWKDIEEYPQLKKLYEECQGWWIFGRFGEEFLNLEEWLSFKDLPPDPDLYM